MVSEHLVDLARIVCRYNAELSGGDCLDDAIYMAFIRLATTLDEVEDELATVQRELETQQA